MADIVKPQVGKRGWNVAFDAVVDRLNNPPVEQLAGFGSNWFMGDRVEAQTTPQIDDAITQAQILGPRPLLLIFHVAYDSSNVLRIVQHGFDTTTHAESKVDYNVSKLTAAGFPIYAIKIHQQGITSGQVTSQFWTDYRALVTTLANKYAARADTQYFFVTNEFEVATGNTANTVALQGLINDVKTAGYKAAMAFNHTNEASRCVVIDSLDGVGVNIYPALSANGFATTDAQVIAGWEAYGAAEYFRYRKFVAPTKDCFITEVGCTDKAGALEYPAKWDWASAPDNNGAVIGRFWEGTFQYLIGEGEAIDHVFGFDQGIYNPYKFSSSLAIMKKYVEVGQ